MNEITKWTFGESEVRTIEQNGEPWWVLADVCRVLELTNPRATAERLEEDERRKLELPRQGETWCINESGLYSVILRSDKPQAKPFRKWVTGEVLPTIRKSGSYQAKPQMSQLEMIAGIAQGAAELERRTNALETQVQSVSDKLEQALDVFTEPLADTDWNGSINRRISTVCERHHLNQMKTRHELYVELEQIARCNLAARKLHKQKRMEKAGYRYREVQAVSKLDIIAEDPKLMAVFDGVVRRFEARYIQGANVQMGMCLDDLIDF